MKSYDSVRIRQAEAAQLILLQTLFTHRESRRFFFQGGTAIRWFYGGLRFSEDLDFASALPGYRTGEILKSLEREFARQLAAHFGPGEVAVRQKSSSSSSYRAFVDYRPAGVRNKISIKLEFESLQAGKQPDSRRLIMQSSPAVSHLLREGSLKVPGFPGVITLETPEEILSDKLRALLERRYTKGRDFFDIWYLTQTLGVKSDPQGLGRKLEMYRTPFRIRTPAAFYAGLSGLPPVERKGLIQTIRSDLSRFIRPEMIEVFEQNDFAELLGAVQQTFQEIVASKEVDFDRFKEKT
jgi:predicted nucleotidyltransferase component of viral defense system